MQSTIIRLLRNGEVTYIHEEDLKLHKGTEFYVNREAACSPNRKEGHVMVMIQRHETALLGLAKDLGQTAYSKVSDEELETGEYIPIVEWKLHLSKGFEPY